jgi:3-oxoacyl-[acyl-carrier-protein] synthase II
MHRRIVITGAGTVSAAGVGNDALWAALEQRRSCAGPPKALDLSGFASQLACEIPGFSARDYLPKNYRKATKVMARDTEIAVVCAKLACDAAGLVTRANETGAATTYPPERVGCQIGAGLIAAETEELTSALASAVVSNGSPARSGFSYEAWGTVVDGQEVASGGQARGMDNLQPLWMLKYLPNMLACHVTIVHGCEGPSNTITCAEASGLLCIGESARVIERDDADAAIAGSAESKLNHMGFTRMRLMGRLAPCSPDQQALSVSRPYDHASQGSILGEGGGLVVLEEAQAAQRRGATPLASLLGFASSQSTQCTRLGTPHTDASSLAQAIRAAIRDAKLSADSIDFIVPQGSGVPAIDSAEIAALESIFGSRLRKLPAVMLPPSIGDCVAGNGGLQAAIAAMILQRKSAPGQPCNIFGDKLQGCAPSCGMTWSGSMGGQNAALVLGVA